MHTILDVSDYSDPQTVVTAFIEAMNAWEIETEDFHYKNRKSGNHKEIWRTTNYSLAAIFADLCTSKERPHGRDGRFQKPPEYDPKNDVIKTVDLSGRRAKVETFREAILGRGRYQYVLIKQFDRWFIDNVKHRLSGSANVLRRPIEIAPKI